MRAGSWNDPSLDCELISSSQSRPTPLRGFVITALVALVLIVVAQPAQATAYTAIASGAWSDPSKWSTSGIPGSSTGDTVVIPASITIMMDYGMPNDLAGFDNAGTLTMASGNLRLGAGTNTSSGTMNITSGTLTINSATLTLAGGSSFNVANATLSGGTIACNGSMTIGDSTLMSALTINNTGSVVFNSTNMLMMNSGTIFNNNSGGVFDARNNGQLGYGGGAFPIFNNNAGATFKKTTTAGTTSSNGFLTLNNDGTVEAQTGTILMFPGTSSGTFRASTPQSIDFNGGVTHSMNGASIDGNGVKLNGGTISGAGGLTVLGGATMTWSSGDMSGAGTTTIAATGTLAITGGVTLNTRTIVNNGTILWNSAGADFQLGNGAVIDNDNIFDDQNTVNARIIAAFGATGSFNNGGTFRKTAGAAATTSFQGGLPLDNSGTVGAQVGKIVVAGGTSSGLFTVTGTAVVQFAATHTMNGATVGGGGGVHLDGGTIQGPSFVIPSGATLKWISGTMGGTASDVTTINAGGTLRIMGLVTQNARTIENNGSVIFSSGGADFQFGNGATFNNNATGVFDDQNAGNARLVYAFGAQGIFNNAGTLTKTAGSSTFSFQGNLPVTSSGTVQAQTGTMSFGPYTQTAGTTTSGPGSLTFASGMNLNGGILNGTGTITGNVINNGGAVNPGTSPGALTISGNYTQGASGSLNIELQGLTAGTQFDQLNVTGTATLDGTLNVTLIGGYSPMGGDTFDVLTFGSRSGDFAPPKNLPSGGGVSFTATYGATFLRLTAAVTQANLAVTQSAPSPILQNDTAVFTITVTNNGPSNATNVTVTSTFSGGAFASASSSQGTCGGTGPVTCALGGLTSGSSATITLTINASSAGTISNTATVAASEFDPNSTNNTASSSVTVDAIGGPPAVVVSANPSPLFVEAGSAQATSSFVISNLGGTATTVLLGRSGNFFSISTSGVTLAPSASETITATSLAQPIGAYSGEVALSGDGVPSGLSIPVSLIVYGPQGATNPEIEPEMVRIDVAGAGPILTGSVGFRNDGTTPATGVFVSESPWLIPDGTPVTIPPAQRASNAFTINRAFRANPESVESLLTTVRFVYAPRQGATGRSANDTGAGNATQPGLQASDIPSLAGALTSLPSLTGGQIGLTIPGVRSLTIPSGRILTDLLVSSSITERNLGVYLLEKDASSNAAVRAANATSVSATEPLLLADVVGKGFNKPVTTGSLHFRSTLSSSLSVSSLIQVLDDQSQLLVFRDSPSARSDRGAIPGAVLYLPGVATFDESSAVIYVQEVAGAATEVEIQLLDAAGAIVQTLARRPVAPFQMIEQQVGLSSGVATILVRNSGSGGRITAIGEELSLTRLDTRSLWDSGSIYGNRRDEAMVIPYSASSGRAKPVRRRPVRLSPGNGKEFVAEAVGTTSTPLALFSPGGSRVELELRTATRTAKTTIELAAGQTRSFADAFAELFSTTSPETGAIVLRPLTGEIVAAAWLVGGAVAGKPVVLTLPVLPLASAPSTVTTFFSVSDSSTASISSKGAGAVTPMLGLVESTGNAVTVDVVVKYAVDRSAAAPFFTRRYVLTANQVLQIDDVVRAVAGAARETAPDLFNVTISARVVSGTGSVIPFLVTRALRSGDQTIRVR